MELKTNEVYTFKLMSGEEVIGKITEIGDKYICLNEPLSVAPSAQGMGLVPSVFTSEANAPVRLNINNITMYTDTAEPVKVKYIETTTGIKVPEKKILVG
jgi:hypothetical protein